MKAQKHIRTLLLLLVIFLFTAIGTTPASAASYGTPPSIPTTGDVWDGSIEEPETLVQKDGIYYYEITKCSQLAYVARTGGDWLNYNYILGNDLILNDVEFMFDEDEDLINDPSSMIEWVPIGNRQNIFMGKFDGAGYTISGLYINQPSNDFVGLIGSAGTNTTICNVTVMNSCVIGDERVGSIVGNSTNVVSNCINFGRVRGTSSVGGVLGSGWHVQNCENRGTIHGVSEVGGVSGYGTMLSACSNYGTVFGTDTIGGISGASSRVGDSINCGIITGDSMVGGIIGSGNVNNSSNQGLVSGTKNIGGIVGKSEYVSNCYNNGLVSGNSNCGGIVGTGNDSSNYLRLENCLNIGIIQFSTADTTGKMGAIIGSDGALWSTSYLISSSYYLSDSGEIFGCGGVTSHQAEPDGLIPKNKDELRMIITYEGWDFSETWSIDPAENGGYPYLSWQTPSAIPVSGVSLNKETLSLAIGDQEYLIATVSPITADDSSCTWASSNDQVASVSQSGKITAIAPGSAEISVTTQDGGYTAVCAVTVLGRTSNEYRINSVTLRDPNGELLRQIPAGSFWASVSITNQTSSGDTLVLLVSYDTNGKYLDMMCAQARDLPVGTTIELSFLMKNSNAQTASVKAFLISSLTDLTPIGEAVSWQP